MDLFDLFAKISLDTSEYEEGLEKSEKQASNFGNKLKTGLGTAAKAGGIAIGAIATGTAALGTAMVKGAGEVASYGDNIDKMSQKMGISAQAYQEWDAILQHSGTSIDGMQRGMMTLSKAAESGSDAFQKLGLSQEEVASMNQEELFAATIRGLQGMEEGSERTVLAQQLLGGAAKELGALLNTSAEDTEAMRQRVHELGGVMSDEAVKAAAAYQDSLQDMNTSLDGLKRGIFTNFMPGITGVMDGLTEIFSGDPDSGVAKINNGISDMVQKISDGLPKVMEIGGKIVNGLISAIVDNLPQILESGAKIIEEIAMGIIQNLPKLVQSGLDIIVSLANGIGENLDEIIPAIVDVIIAIVEVLTDPENLEMLVKAAIAIVEGLVKGIIKAIPKLIEAAGKLLTGFVETIIKGIVKVQEVGKKVATKFVDGVKSWFSSIKDAGKQIIENVKDGISSTFESFKNGIADKFQSVKDAITKPFQDAYDWVKGIVDKLKNLFDFDWSLPKIKLPHFHVDWRKVGDWLSLPSISIDWYKKAYDKPYLFTSPTVMATASGLKGFGDGQGGEIVYGRENLLRDIKDAIGGLANVQIVVNARAGQSAKEIAMEVKNELVRFERQRKVGALA